MSSGIRYGLIAITSMLTTALPAHAKDQTFADLLAQAKAQVASGHRWAPPGDNMTETVMTMMNLIPTATPEQLSALSALLDSEKSGGSVTASSSDSTTEKPPGTETQPVAETRQAAETQQVEQQPDQASSAPSVQTPLVTTLAATPIPRTVPQEGSRPGGAKATVREVTADQMVSVQKPAVFATADPTLSAVLHDHAEPRGSTDLTPSEKVPAHSTPNQTIPSPLPATRFTPTQLTPESGRHAAVLYARGFDAELRGDFSAARRFYSTAAQQGDAAAARNLGRLYDPAFIKKTAVGGVDPDPALARQWYERAVRLGDAEAAPLLEALSTR